MLLLHPLDMSDNCDHTEQRSFGKCHHNNIIYIGSKDLSARGTLGL